MIAGEGPETDTWKHLERTFEILDRVFFPGRITGETKTAYYQHAAAVLMPSLEEACPIVAIEAITCGKTLLMSDIDAFSLFIGDNLPHRMLPLIDLEAWKEAILKFPAVPNDNDRAAILKQSEDYTIESVVRKHESLYKSILA